MTTREAFTNDLIGKCYVCCAINASEGVEMGAVESSRLYFCYWSWFLLQGFVEETPLWWSKCVGAWDIIGSRWRGAWGGGTRGERGEGQGGRV